MPIASSAPAFDDNPLRGRAEPADIPRCGNTTDQVDRRHSARSGGLTWAAHSSVAVVLLIMTFAAQAVVPPHAAFALVLGANLGTALNPLLESGVGGDPAAKRLPTATTTVRCRLASFLASI